MKLSASANGSAQSSDDAISLAMIYEQPGSKESKKALAREGGDGAKNGAIDFALPWTQISITNKESSTETYSEALIAGTAGVTATLSVGYVLWSLRAASLISTFLASMPAWQAFDPLPVLDFENRRRDQKDEDDEDSDESQKLFTSADAVV